LFEIKGHSPRFFVRLVVGEFRIAEKAPEIAWVHPEPFTFRSQCICLFQEIGGIEVLVFSMYLQVCDKKRGRTEQNFSLWCWWSQNQLNSQISKQVLIRYFDFMRIYKGFERVSFGHHHQGRAMRISFPQGLFTSDAQ